MLQLLYLATHPEPWICFWMERSVSPGPSKVTAAKTAHPPKRRREVLHSSRLLQRIDRNSVDLNWGDRSDWNAESNGPLQSKIGPLFSASDLRRPRHETPARAVSTPVQKLVRNLDWSGPGLPCAGCRGSPGVISNGAGLGIEFGDLPPPSPSSSQSSRPSTTGSPSHPGPPS